jgi:hypothetical protein
VFEILGCCTQIAVFTEATPRSMPIAIPPSWRSLETVTYLHYPCNIFTGYPPDPSTIATILGGLWRQLRPEYNPDVSGYVPSPMVKLFDGVFFETEDVLVCQITLQRLWDLNYSVQKLCRFNMEIFLKVSKSLDGNVYDRGVLLTILILTLEFVGIECRGGSLRSFRFAEINGHSTIFYEFSKDPPVWKPDVLEDDVIL